MGLMACAPVNTPVLSFARSVRSRSLFEAIDFLYDSTASLFSGDVNSETSGCSGAITMYVAPYSVSGRVVKTRSFLPFALESAISKSTSAPSERPIQLV